MRKKFAENPYDPYREHAHANEIEIIQSDQCGCFFCRSMFSAREVNEWVNDEKGMSALCPRCGMDAVIGDASGVPLDKTLLKSMNLMYFGDDFMAEHPEAARIYCERYLDGKITHKKHNEELFLRYLGLLAASGDEPSCLALATFYIRGGEFSEPNFERAEQLLSSPTLQFNPDALCNLGFLYYHNLAGDPRMNSRNAYECFAKAAALGSIRAVYHMADCYRDGIYVKMDRPFALRLLEEAFYDIYPSYVSSRKEMDSFPELTYRLGKAYAAGENPDLGEALKMFLLCACGISMLDVFSPGSINSEIARDCAVEIDRLAKRLKLRHQEPVFDQDTFYDSFSLYADDTSSKSFKTLNYDADKGVVEFSVSYPTNPLIIDVGNIFCGFVGSPITWTFDNVAYFHSAKAARFEKIVPGNEEGWRFVHVEADGSETTVAEVRFRRGPRG